MTSFHPCATQELIELFRGHPAVKESPELLPQWINRYCEESFGSAASAGVRQPPEFMRKTRRWSVFRKQWNETRQKYDKIVCTPTGGNPYPGFPNPERREDFAEYSDVIRLCQIDNSFVAAFYILKKDRLLFLDFDQPCDVPKFRTYTERSISGGYHVFGWYDGPKPTFPDCREVYQDRRWVIVTGDAIDGKYDINDITADVEDLGAIPKVSSYAVKFTGKKPALTKPVNAGGRNIALTSIAGAMRSRGADEFTICAALYEENRKCIPPLPDAEVQRIAHSMMRYTPMKDRASLAAKTILKDVGVLK